jgi:hypothetical protein
VTAGGELRGPAAPEAWNQATRPGFIPPFEPLATDTAAGTNACSGFLDRISGIEVAHETESADDFLVVRLLDLCSQFVIREVSFNHSSSRSHSERYASEGQELALGPTARRRASCHDSARRDVLQRGEQFVLFAALDPATREVVHLGVAPSRNYLTTRRFLEEIEELYGDHPEVVISDGTTGYGAAFG